VTPHGNSISDNYWRCDGRHGVHHFGQPPTSTTTTRRVITGMAYRIILLITITPFTFSSPLFVTIKLSRIWKWKICWNEEEDFKDIFSKSIMKYQGHLYPNYPLVRTIYTQKHTHKDIEKWRRKDWDDSFKLEEPTPTSFFQNTSKNSICKTFPFYLTVDITRQLTSFQHPNLKILGH